MQGTVGWLCPKCGSVVSPYETACAKCAPATSPYLGSGSYTFNLGNVTFGTVYAAPEKTAAQKLDEAQKARAEAERKAEKYSEWADKIITFYEQLNDLTEELDDLTNEPDEIEHGD